MNQERQRIAIAQACGWTWDAHWLTLPRTPDMVCWKGPSGEYDSVPDYLNDLNAMHEAEKVLGKYGVAEQLMYLNFLSPIQNKWTLTTATAAQRAEAFLKTLGLWEAKP